MNNVLPPVLSNIYYDLKLQYFLFKYRDLLNSNGKLKNQKRGQRCFLLGSGPSVKGQDLSVLRDEDVFALNNFCAYDGFEEIFSGKGAKYYAIAPIHPPQTDEEWRDWLTSVDEKVPSGVKMFLGINYYRGNIHEGSNSKNLFSKKEVYWFFAGGRFSEKFKSENIDLTKDLLNSETVSLYALMIAIYMGYSEIYLVGMDHNYLLFDSEEKMRVYRDGIHQKNEFQRTFGDRFYIEEYLRQYKIFSKYYALNLGDNYQVYNATDGGLLEVFPRVDFSTLL